MVQITVVVPIAIVVVVFLIPFLMPLLTLREYSIIRWTAACLRKSSCLPSQLESLHYVM
jgi:uncharacterized membrane protein